MKKTLLCILFLATACGAPPADTPTQTVGAFPTPALTVVKVYATAAAQAWQTQLFKCAAKQSVTLMLTEPGSADILLRIGEPDNLSMRALPAFQLGWEQIVVVVNNARSSTQLRTEQSAELFTGQISDWGQITPLSPPIFGVQNGGMQGGPQAVHAWVFAQGDDVQQVFAKTLAGKPIVSNARLAASPDEMSQAIANDPNAVGILSRRWKTENLSDIYVAASAPVLAITPSEPQGVVKNLLVCLQGSE